MLTLNIRALLALAFTILIWGVAPVYIRSFSLIAGPADALVIRYGLVSLLCLVFLPFFGGFRMPRQDWPRLALISLIGMLGYNLGSVFGFALVTAGIGGLIIATQPLLIAVLAALLGAERLTHAAVLGIAVAFIGAVLLISGDLGSGLDPQDLLLGSGLIFASGLAWALYVVLAKPLIQRHGAFKITALSFLIASVPMFGLASGTTIPTALNLDSAGLFALFYMVVPSTFITVITWNYAVGHLKPSAVGASLYLIPLLAVVSGAVLLGEAVTTTALTSGAIILCGVAIAQFGPLLRLDGKTWALAAVLFAVTTWGGLAVAMRFLVSDIPPGHVMFYRLVPSGLVGAAIAVYLGVRPIAARDWLRILIASLVGNLGYQLLSNFGIKTVPAMWTGMIWGLEPVFIAIAAVVLAGERLTRSLLAGMAVALSGTAMLVVGAASGMSSEVGLPGLAMVIASTMGWGIYTVVLRPVANRYGIVPITCITLAVSALPVFVFAGPSMAQDFERMGPPQWTAVVYLSLFATVGAFIAWNYGAARMNSSTAGIFLYVQPIVAAIGGILILGERFTWPLAAGGALIILGVAVAQFGPHLQKSRVGVNQEPD